MDIVLVESTNAVCIFGLGLGLLALAAYKGGSFIERKLDEADRKQEREVNVIGNKRQSAS
ncbi:hypothetical protein ABR769_25635 [Bacillus cereus]|uniref:hypothetical protein n=1 Tax=Bacillus cereus TaxID=1396 RepID=UPI0001A12544|nr:hypothetical protein [Bacillus cereus]EEL73402.1 hypothetical protein bcere0027_53210 [Bacillus cereus AH676]